MGVGAGPDLHGHARRHWGWMMTPVLSPTPLVFFVSGSFSTRECVAESPSRKARVRLSRGGAEPRYILQRRVRNRRSSLRPLASRGPLKQ